MLKNIKIIFILAILLNYLEYVQCTFFEKEFKIGNGQKLPLTSCAKIIFRTGFKKARFEISQPHDIRAVLFTDKEINVAECGLTNMYEACLKNSNICSYSTEVSTEIAYEAGFCAEKIFMYVQVASPEAKINVEARLVENNIEKGACNKINDHDRYVKCASISVDQCKTKCYFDCVHLSCQQDKNEVFSICAPGKLGDSEYLQQCQIQYGVNGYKKIDQCNSYIKEGQAEIRDHPAIIWIATLLLLWVLSIWFYNWRLQKTGEPPFPVFCCPEICYPRQRIFYPEQYYNADHREQRFSANKLNEDTEILQKEEPHQYQEMAEQPQLQPTEQKKKSQIENFVRQDSK